MRYLCWTSSTLFPFERSERLHQTVSSNIGIGLQVRWQTLLFFLIQITPFGGSVFDYLRCQFPTFWGTRDLKNIIVPWMRVLRGMLVDDDWDTERRWFQMSEQTRCLACAVHSRVLLCRVNLMSQMM